MATLSGITVVSLEQAVAAPLCTARLADSGARVIKIERPEGDFARGYDHVVQGESAYFVWLNRGKQSCVANLKDEADLALVRAMIARADVFVQNLAPGAIDRLGLSIGSLRARHRRLICCSISGFGEEGPYRDAKAYDLLVQAETGLASITGTPEAPGRVGVSIADIACGTNAYAAILDALLARERTGEGSTLAVSLFDSLAEWMAVPLLHHDYGGKAPSRVGMAHPSIAPYGTYRCGDGTAIVVAVQNEREWASFCARVLCDETLATRPEFSSNSSRCANRVMLDKAIGAALAPIDGAEFARRLDAARIAHGRLNGVDGLSSHPQLRRVEVDTPGGAAVIPAPPAVRNGDSRPTLGPVPAIGADTAALREEFGS
ncbi:carnitine dehydratase [Novosphingobium sp. PC22D]|uniref:CaiB/BaiF CoA transferase family protein n=1 Tax=Novosphingobium sp. PC22D TaxID=1962403 RepID=UPI000BF1A583|nr:CoA transferase [Novosphingobium sp. PC22D]PEQ11363.1 carnitine dehydratase [Novosphingobium sp. PC22D]